MAGFKFEGYQSPFANSIASLMLRRGDIAAQQAQTVGNAQANAAQQSGQAWGNAFNNIGQSVAAIPGQMEQAKRQGMQDKLNALALTKATREESDVTAQDEAFKLGDRDKILNALPGHLRTKVAKQFADADTAAGKVSKTQAELEKLNNDYLAGLGASVAEHGYDLGATGLALQHARNTYEQANNSQMVQQIDQIAQQLQSDPNSVKQIVDGVIARSPERVKMMQTEKHQTAQETQSATTAEETARHNAALETISKATGDRAAAAQKETARHNAEMERLRGVQISQNEAAPSLSPEAITLTAKQFAMTGQLPPMGMGKAGAAIRTSIINAAAEQYKGLDLASQKAAYEANRKSLDGLQKQRDAIGAFEQTASKNIDTFLATAGKVVDTGSPYLNQPIRAITGKLLGSPDQAAFDAARQVAINEIAKITSNPNLSGTLSDSARHEVEAFNPQSATLKQTVAVMRLLKQDMQNRTGSLDDQIKAIQTRIATPPGQQSSTENHAPTSGDTRTANGVTATWKNGPQGWGWYK